MKFIEERYKLIIQLIGILFFGTLFSLAWHFYIERMLCLDPAFFAFKMLEYKKFSIELGRWGVVLNQIFPLLALKYNASLETFLRIYSISFIIIYYFIFLIITLVFKDYRAAIALMLTLCLAFRHSFYYSTMELFQGLALCILCWSAIRSMIKSQARGRKIFLLTFSVALIYVISYHHQLSFFAIFFIILIEIIGDKMFKNPYLWAILAFTLLWYYVRINFLTTSDYEKNKLISLDTIITQLPNFFNLPSKIYFIKFARSELWSLFLLNIFLIVFAFIRKNWLFLLFFPLYFICFIVFVCIIYYQGESPSMQQSYYTLLGLFSGVALMHLTYDRLTKKILILLIGSLIFINVKGIYNSHFIYTKRFQYVDRLIKHAKKFKNKKFLIDSRNYPWQITWVKWAFPFETLLYSSLQSPDSAVSFFIADPQKNLDTLINRENVFLGPDWAPTWFSSNSMNRKYIRLPSDGYIRLNSEQDSSILKNYLLIQNKVDIKPINNIISSDADTFVVVPFEIVNNSGKKIASTRVNSDGLGLSYHIYDYSEKLLVWQGAFTELEVDITDNYVQGVSVTLPKKKGKYIIEVDFATKSGYWWFKNKRFILLVK